MLRVLWPLPITLAGVVLGAVNLLFGGSFRREDIALEATAGMAPAFLWLINPRARIDAITLGHVIIVRSAGLAHALRTHEQAHVRQYERWGILFPFAYLAASAAAHLKGGCAYRDNCFEVDARAAKAR